MFKKIRCISAFSAIVFFSYCADCYNLSPQPNVVLKDPQLETFMPKNRSSYFGFSLNLRPKGIIIGAPRAQSTLNLQREVNETGAIYRCPLDQSTPCYPYVFNETGNINVTKIDYTIDSEIKDYQWLGASIDGGPKDTDKLIVCAPRLIAAFLNEDYLMHGVCYWLNDTLTEQPTQISRISPLRLVRFQIRREGGIKFYYYMFAEQGISAHITPDNEEFLIGAPGIHTWKGSVIRYRKCLTNDEPGLAKRDTQSAFRVRRQLDSDIESNKVCYETDIPNPQRFNQPNDTYFGYSVSSGYFDSNDKQKLLYLGSAPQANEESGEAYIFDYIKDSIKKYFVFRGDQFGEYFGYAVLAEDLNGDGLTDVVVSAPQHRVSGLHDNGAIYVFMNQGNFNFEQKTIHSPVEGKARFGTTLTILGDINHDGYNDIAVGAPFAGDGSVFVYLGSEKGLRDQFSQRLDSPTKFISTSYINHMFGHGLSRGSDIDGNGFNDLAIGAPNAETVLLYKAYPVVKIFANLKSDAREIKPDQTKFSLSVCYSISTTSTKILSQDLNMNVVIDPQIKRVSISPSGQNEIKFKAEAKLQKQCKILECDVKFIQSEVFKPIEMELRYSLVNEVPNSEVFCDICAAVDPAQPKVYTEKIIFSTGCSSKICIADMQVKSVGLNHSLVLGTKTTLKVTYEVSNMGDTAYLPQINITSSNGLPFAKYPSNCRVHEAIMLCDLNQGQAMLKGSNDSVTVIYDVSSLSGKAMILTAEVFSTGEELNPDNNIIKDVITLEEITNIEAIGIPKTPHINLEEVSNSAEVENNYEIKSIGPSNVASMKVVFNIPVAYKIPGSSAIISIIDVNNIAMHGNYKSQLIPINFFQNNITLLMNSISSMTSPLSVNEKENFDNDFVGSVISDSIKHGRSRREVTPFGTSKKQYARIANVKFYDLLSDDLKGTLPVNRTIVFNCNDPQMTVYAQAVMEVFNFKPETPINISLSYKVDLTEVNKILIKPWEFFVILIDLDVVKTNGLASTLKVNKKIEYNIISKHQLYGTPIWVIILAILGGILVLALITYGMYRAGFFRRGTKEEMKKLLHQAAVKRMSVVAPLHENY